MTPDFDEEVVFENSPLYQYLQDLGHTDFEICSSLSPKPEKSTVTEGQQKPPARALPKQSILLKVAETIKSWIFSQYNKKDDLLHKLVEPSSFFNDTRIVVRYTDPYTFFCGLIIVCIVLIFSFLVLCHWPHVSL
uniref:Vezatin, adherens junctions transmembrane protein n=1 Tax=Felis catus TaxID=9685 RepID=A0ABI7ZW22_FELCA